VKGAIVKPLSVVAAELDQILLHAKLVPADKKMWDDGVRLRAWTNDYLDAMARALPAELHDTLDEALQKLTEAKEHIKTTKKMLAQTLAVVRQLNPNIPYPEQRGRPSGSSMQLVAANATVDRIRRLWKITFGKQNRFATPTAIELAAVRHGVTQKALITYRKNLGVTRP
jgi:hypothetical protein